MGGAAMDPNQPWVADYVNSMMNDRKFVEDAYHRLQTTKVFEWAEANVTPEEKALSVSEFSAELEKHQHHHH